MHRKLFALKIPKKERDAMDLVASETGETLSKMFYPSLKQAIYERLGIVMLYRMRNQNLKGSDEVINTLLAAEHVSYESLPQILIDFADLMVEERFQHKFKEIFDNIVLVEKGDILGEIDLRDVASKIGKAYLMRSEEIEKIDLDLARNIFFSEMISLYYRQYAVGSLKHLNIQWYQKKHKIANFRESMKEAFLEQVRKEPIEAITVVEVDEYND